MSVKNDKSLLCVYALVGTDKLRIKKVLDKLNKRLQDFGDMSFNTSSFNCDDANGAEIIQACNQLPFAAKKRYVLLNNADKLKKDDVDVIIKYLEAPTETTILVFVFNKLAKNTKLFKAISKISPSSIINCTPLKKYEIAPSLQKIARSYGGSIEMNAANKLVELVGEDTLQLDSEINKLLMASPDNNISLDLINDYVTKISDVKPWDFTNAFAKRDLKTSLNLFKQMGDGVEYQLLPQVCRVVKELICVKELGNTASQTFIAQTLAYEPWRVKNHHAWSRNFRLDELIDILKKALDCEVKMKSTINSREAFEMFVIESLAK